MSDADERFHAFDSLRAAAMLLGIFFHASLAYVDPPLSFWVVQDESRHLGFGVFAWVSHSFRMQLFFVIAGFFARLVFHRYGSWRYTRHRAVRLALPFIVGVLLNNAIQGSFFHYTYAAGLVVPDAAEMAAAAAQPFGWASYFDHFSLGVYWFLEYLICFSAAALATLALGARTRRYRGTAGGAALDRRLAALVRSPWKPGWLAMPHAALLYWTGEWGVGSPAGILPELVWLLYYGSFFGFGWALHRQPALLGDLRKGTGRDLFCALVVGAAALGISVAGYVGEPPAPAVLRGIALLLTATFTWLMIFGSMGLFLRVFRHESPAIRYVSDSSYWLYLTHDYYVMGLQILLAPLLLPAPLKFTIVVVGALSVLFLSYELGVRYTFIGAVLNGRKQRTRRHQKMVMARADRLL
ncbi:MAG: acyltransferase family protein [Proteobacteria bacterium]|nr:acyltransferase family protein [Pseudomonadota bacterium]